MHRLGDADPRGGALQLEPKRVGVRLGMQRFRARGLELGGDDVAVVGFAFEMRFRDVRARASNPTARLRATRSA